MRLFTLLAVSAVTATAAPAPSASHSRQVLSETFFAEGSAFADLDRDGNIDVVAGPFWYAGPNFAVARPLYPAVPFDPLKYSDNFLVFPHDIDRDGWTDLLVVGFPGKEASWLRNPGKAATSAGAAGWERHVIWELVDNESPVFGDLLANGRPVLLCSTGGRLGYLAPTASDPTARWTFHPISPPGPWQRFTHGLGYGDINGDGRPDFLERDAWWEQPAALAGDPIWRKHPVAFAPGADGKAARGGAQMLVVDVNGDGRNDVITSIDSHGYGLSWFENVRAADGGVGFREHVILPRDPAGSLAGVQFSQHHALALGDVDGDGLADLVTGKRWWAHGPTGDPDPNGTPYLYAFLLRRGPDGATFQPHRIDDASGVGTQVSVADINRDGKADVVSSNKRGTFVFVSRRPGGR
jgi:hypothetical protein